MAKKGLDSKLFLDFSNRPRQPVRFKKTKNLITQVNVRAWDEPPHVGIFQRHPEEYQEEIKKFMEQHIFSNNHSGKTVKEAMAV